MSSPCKITPYAPTTNGYGRTKYKGKMQYHHRIVFAESNNMTMDDLQGKVIMHTCDNRRCVNPEHLVLADQVANMKDMIAKDRSTVIGKQGKHNVNAKLNDDTVRAIMQESTRLTHEEMGAKYGVSASTVSLIRSGKIWKHITNQS